MCISYYAEKNYSSPGALLNTQVRTIRQVYYYGLNIINYMSTF